MFFKPQHVHFVGIGGIGMSAIAEVLLTLGYRVSGSDLKSSAVTDRLAKMGATIKLGHRAENVEGAKAAQHREQFGDIAQAVAQLVRLRQNGPHLRRCVAKVGRLAERQAKRQLQFLLIALGGVGHGAQQAKRCAKMSRRFDMG